MIDFGQNVSLDFAAHSIADCEREREKEREKKREKKNEMRIECKFIETEM
jgi:hypothetical protein